MKLDEFFNPQLRRHRMILKYIENGKVLDFGACRGQLHKFLVENSSSKIVSVDITGNPDIRADLNKKFPFPNNFADSIVAGEIIEHISNPLYFLEECYRVLKPGGNLIITTPNLRGIQIFFGFDDKEHVNGWTLPMFKRLVSQTKFKIDKAEYVPFFNTLLLRIISHFIPQISSTVFFVLRKKN